VSGELNCFRVLTPTTRVDPSHAHVMTDDRFEHVPLQMCWLKSHETKERRLDILLRTPSSTPYSSELMVNSTHSGAGLRGDADVGRLVERAEPFGLDMARSHQVALAAPSGRLNEAEPAISDLERAVVLWAGDRDVLVATKDGWVVAVTPADTDVPGPRAGPKTLGDLMVTELERTPRGRPWRVSVGRPYPGSYGIARSYEEAREGLTMAVQLGLDSLLIQTEQLLIYRVLLRDQPAIADLVQSVLGQLVHARGGAESFLATLDAYFATGAVTTETARRLHLSVRAVTYRLDRIKTLTAYDPTDPAQRFTIHAAVLGAKLLGWPQRTLPVERSPQGHGLAGPMGS
jgi:sugar diacid utilization regulator